MQRLHRHVQFVAVRVLQDQEFAGVARDVHGLKADVAADPIGLVHHRRADAQVRELLEYFRRIALGLATAAFLARAVAEQLRLGEYFQGRRLELQARRGRRNGDAEWQSTGNEAGKIVVDLRLHAAAAQQIEDEFAPARRFGRQQDARTGGPDMRHQFGRGLFGARIDAHGGRRGARKILHVALGPRRPLEGLQLHLGPGSERLAKFCRRQIHFLGIQDGPLPVMAQLLMALHDAVPQVLGHRRRFVHVDEHAARRQILEQMRGALEEQRQEEFDAARCCPGADIAIDVLFRQVPAEAQPVAAAELAHRIGVQRCFPRRQQFDALQLVQRTLRVGIEAPDAVHVAVQHIDAEGSIRTHREHVDERTAHGELAMRRHLCHCGVPGTGELRAQSVKVQRVVRMHLEGIRLDVTARSQPLQQRVDGHQPDALARVRQFRQCGESRGSDIRMRGEAVVGQRFQVGKHAHAQAWLAEEADLLRQAFCIARALRDDDQGTWGLGCGLGDGQCRRRAVQPAPFDRARLVYGQGWVK